MNAPKKRLGDQLIDKGLVTKDQVEIAITEQKKSSHPLGQVLIELGFITEAVVRVTPLPELEEFHAFFFPDFRKHHF